MPNRGSMYTTEYLQETATGHLITPGTFLEYVLHGRAKRYRSRYEAALVRDLRSLPGVRPVRSIGGRTAYVASRLTQSREV